MAEWLYEAGISEARAALVEDGRILAARIERDGTLAVGTVLDARLVDAREGRVAWKGGEALLARPAGVPEGTTLRVEITRAAIPEQGRTKLPRATPTDAAPRAGPTLRERLDGPVRQLLAHQPDALEEAGWSEVMEEARTGDIGFPGGALRMSPTPAMTLFDIDGSGDLETLAIAGATAAAAAIVRHDIGGSIGIDFPTLSGKAPRQAVAAAIDAALPPPFERTAVNGFGFLQIIRPRPRASLPEIVRADPVLTDALAALRSLERTAAADRHPVRLQPRVAALIESRPDWIAELVKRTGFAPIFTA